MRIFLKWITKTTIAGVAAYLVLGAFSLVYFNDSGTYPPLPFYMQAREGFGYGTMGRDGRMSHLDLPNNDEYGVVIMGSSHIDAIQIPQTKTTSYLLKEKLGGLGVYSKSGNAYYLLLQMRDFLSVVEDKNPRYVVMETGSISFDNESVQNFLDDNVSQSATTNDVYAVNSINSIEIVRRIKSLPYIRLLTVQRGNIVNRKSNSVNSALSHATQGQLNSLLQKISNAAKDKNVRIIIFYHPILRINDDGTAMPTTDPESLQQFASACANADIIFIDMTDVFQDAYNTSYIFPNGFSNTPIGSGHMNVHGHRMVAEELARVILEMEGNS